MEVATNSDSSSVLAATTDPTVVAGFAAIVGSVAAASLANFDSSRYVEKPLPLNE